MNLTQLRKLRIRRLNQQQYQHFRRRAFSMDKSKLHELQNRATEKLFKKRKTSGRVQRLESLLELAKIRNAVAVAEYNSAVLACEKEIGMLYSKEE